MALTIGPCGRCGADVISGRSDGATHWDAIVDSTPLDPLQELSAVVAGCRTWTHYTAPGLLYLRGRRIIRERPAGTRARQTVHADHRCPGRTPPR